MARYQVTWHSKNMMMTDYYTANGVWDLIDKVTSEGLASYNWTPTWLEIKILGGAKCKS